VVASLVKLDEAELAAMSGGWNDLPALLRGESPAARPTTQGLPGFESDPSAPRWEQADQEVVGRRIVRHFGKYPDAAAIVVAELIRDADGRTGGVRISS